MSKCFTKRLAALLVVLTMVFTLVPMGVIGAEVEGADYSYAVDYANDYSAKDNEYPSDNGNYPEYEYDYTADDEVNFDEYELVYDILPANEVVAFADHTVANLTQLRALMAGGTVQNGDTILLTSSITIPAGEHLALGFGGANVTLLVGFTAASPHFTVDGSLVLQNGVTLQGRRSPDFAWPDWNDLFERRPDLTHHENVALNATIIQQASNITDGSGNPLWPAGGGITVNNENASFTMNSGSTIRDVRRTVAGGAIRQIYGYVTMNHGAVLEDNYSNVGAGIAIFSSSNTFTMNPGAIIRNNVSHAEGGGIWAGPHSNRLAPYVTVTINGGLIEGNVSGRYGAGVLINGIVNFRMHGGDIVNNHGASAGVGLALVGVPTQNSSLVINGGRIAGNAHVNTDELTNHVSGGNGAIINEAWLNLANEGWLNNLTLADNNVVRITTGTLAEDDRTVTMVWGDGQTITTTPRLAVVWYDPVTDIIDFEIPVPNPEDAYNFFDAPITITLNDDTSITVPSGFNGTWRPDRITVTAPTGDGGTVTFPCGTEYDVPGGATVVWIPPGIFVELPNGGDYDVAFDQPDDGFITITVPEEGGTVIVPGQPPREIYLPDGGIVIIGPDGSVVYPNDILWGDVDGNGTVNLTDVVVLAAFVNSGHTTVMPNPAAANWHGLGYRNSTLTHVIQLASYVNFRTPLPRP